MELFGDVLVLQEARNAIRDDAFLQEISKKNVDLYNDLKDTNIRNKVLNNLARGKSTSVRFSLDTKADLKWSDTSMIPGDLSSGQMYNTGFNVGGKKYVMSLLPEGKDKYIFQFALIKDITFNRNGEIVKGTLPSTEISGTGDAFKVMSIVSNGLIQAMNKFNIKNIVFDSEAQSRTKLYSRLVRVLGKNAGFSSSFNQGLDQFGFDTFTLTNKQFKKSIKNIKKNSKNDVRERFSLDNGSLNNAKDSDYLSSTANVNDQLFMAQTIDEATRKTIKFNKKAIKFNVPDLGKYER